MTAPTQREQEMRAILARQQASGMTQSAFAASLGMRAQTLRWWKGEIARRDRRRGVAGAAPSTSAPVFLPVELTDAPRASAAAISLLLGDVRIEVGADFDAVHLQRVLGAVRGC